jgi:glutamate-1-semialdehyde 2,1-aminomutase
MDVVRSRRVAHVGTFNANPICASAAAAVLATLERGRSEIYEQLEAAAADLANAFETAGDEAGLPLTVNRFGGAAHAFVSDAPLRGIGDIGSADTEAYRQLAAALLDEGVHVIPRGLLYVSTAHDQADLDETWGAVHRAAERVASARRASSPGPATPEEPR